MIPIQIDAKLFVISGIITTAIAQISLKRAGSLEALTFNWGCLFLASIFFYGISFVSYYFALKSFDISTVQPIMMVSIVALITIYGFFAGENFNYYKFFGIAMACFSIILISKN